MPRVKKTTQQPLWTPRGIFRFLDLPAEIRNSIYDFLVKEKRIRVYSLIPRCAESHLQALRLAHTCKQLRAEFPPVFFAHLHVHLHAWRVEYFLHAMCPFNNNDNKKTLCPNSISIYLAGLMTMPYRVSHSLLDILPLLNLRLHHTSLSVIFRWNGRTDPEWNCVPESVAHNLVLFAAFNGTTAAWEVSVRDGRLHHVLVCPGEYRNRVQVELVFKQQPVGTTKLSKEAIPCDLHDLQCLGLQEFNERLTLTMRLPWS